MRLRITREMCGSIDGIRLDDFKVGEVWDVGISLGHYLMGSGFALPVADESPVRIVPVNQERTRHTAGPAPRSVASDRAERRYIRGNFSGRPRPTTRFRRKV
jgi:hypothetical protein